MAYDPTSSLRPALRAMHGYQPLEAPEEIALRHGVDPAAIVKLDGNENPYGPSPRARAALAADLPVHRYPDPDQRRLRAALAERHGVPADCIVGGAGSDELIDLVFRAFVAPGDRVVTASPTFGMYAFGAELAGAEMVDVPRRDGDWALDVEALDAAAEDAQAVFIPSPNNPTGDVLPPGIVDRLLARGALLVVDEAYVEFSHATSLVERAASGEAPLLVLRTFSKWGGLAGLRVGYGVMARALAEVFMRIKQPYGISVAAEAAALAALDDRALLDEQACEVAGTRDRLADALRATGWIDPAPSEANFLLCALAAGDAFSCREAFARRGILVRAFSHPRLARHVRISVGTPEECDRLLAVLDDVREDLEAAAREAKP